MDFSSQPEREIWIKIGGDKGGGTTKFYYKIVHISKTISVNTTVFCMYASNESVPNTWT